MTDPDTRPLPGSAALVLIDVQRDFCADDASLPIEGTAAAIPAVARLASEFRDRAMPIVYVVRPYRRDGSNTDTASKLAIEQHLRDTYSDTLVFAGCNFPNCPRTCIYEASGRDFRAVLVLDAVSGLDDRGIAECRAKGVDVRDLSATLAWLL